VRERDFKTGWSWEKSFEEHEHQWLLYRQNKKKLPIPSAIYISQKEPLGNGVRGNTTEKVL